MKYAAYFEGPNSIVTIRAIDDTTVRSFPRPLYTMTEAAATAQWLNERARGYPRNPNLGPLLGLGVLARHMHDPAAANGTRPT
jgi:hypothetical protein